MPSPRPDDRLASYFAACCRDVTPQDFCGKTRVFYAPLLDRKDSFGFFEAVISGAERRRASRFAKPDDASRFVQRRAFRRYCGAVALARSERLSAVSFDETASGRPHIVGAPGLWFSFSSCATGMLGAWSETHNVGVDLEDRVPFFEAGELADRFFTKAEALAVRNAPDPMRMRVFLDLWTVKEAALKSVGEGLSYGLTAFSAEPGPNPRLTAAPEHYGGPARFEVWRLQQTDACGILVSHRRT